MPYQLWEHSWSAHLALLSQNVEEWVLESLLCCDALLGILDEHLLNKVGACFANDSEVVAHETGLVVLDHLKCLALLL